MTVPSIQFDTAFPALTDHRPLGWQRRLFDRLCSGQQIPRVCDLPTGLGKTSVIPIFVIALARQAQDGAVALPRRLVYVVNRRTVIDQATTVVEKMRRRLRAPDYAEWAGHEQALRTMAAALCRLSSSENEELPLAVSTLRGELADNEEWKVDPARPVVVIGTIDMIGSKLLFSGYGDGRYWRAQHAGLVGQDSLIVHDEAHLTPAFSDLLRQLSEVQGHAGEPRPMRVMELSATSRGGAGPILGLEPEDETDRVVKDRLDAAKRLHVHMIEVAAQDKPADVDKKMLEKLVELSLKHRDAQAKVLVYVRSPEDAQKLLDKLSDQFGKDGVGRTALLTGTVRGYERDQLVRTNAVYHAFLTPESQVNRTVYLVSTSAGEVGIDIDADHMVCDVTTLDSMIQRLGRVNRRGGERRVARVDVVEQSEQVDRKRKPSEVDESIKATQAILDEWAINSHDGIDVSPRGLRVLLEGLDDQRREKAFAPKPAAPSLTDILLDAWSLTTITKQMPGRPEVDSYLHGLEKDPPETYVVWRKEVTLLNGANKVNQDTLADWFQACRIEAHERLHDTTARVQEKLETLLTNHRKENPNRDFPVVVLNERGEAEFPPNKHGEPEWLYLSRIVEKDFRLAYRTVVLPTQAGGLNAPGALDEKAIHEAAKIDVAEEYPTENKGQRRERWLMRQDGDGQRYERLLSGEVAETLPESLRERERITLWQSSEDTGEGGRYLLLMAEPIQSAREHAETARTRQTLDFHLSGITDHMNRITSALGLERGLKEALVMAAGWHDRGKNRAVWQRYACNVDLEVTLAKNAKYLDGRALGGYRHEFGSLLEAEADEQIRSHPETDLILHLIAAHHGWARPYFERNAWDNTRSTAENEDASAEAMRRFARLQQRFGRWGLAWLESLVRCADIAASSPDAESAPQYHHREVGK